MVKYYSQNYEHHFLSFFGQTEFLDRQNMRGLTITKTYQLPPASPFSTTHHSSNYESSDFKFRESDNAEEETHPAKFGSEHVSGDSFS